MNEDNAKHCFYYPTDKDGYRTGHTLCFLHIDDRQFIGQAVCSDNDQFCRKTGRDISFGRAEGAYIRWSANKMQKQLQDTIEEGI